MTTANNNINLVATNRFNENLLVNSYFEQGIINQRGSSTYTTEHNWAYSIDRWKIFNATVTVHSQSITVKSNNVNNYKRIVQMIPCNIYQNSHNFFTGSMWIKIISITGIVHLRICDHTYTYLSGIRLPQGNNIRTSLYSVTLPNYTPPSSINNIGLEILADNNAKSTFEIQIFAAKLEVGKQSTLLPYASYDKALELKKCRYYYRAERAPMWEGYPYQNGQLIAIPYPIYEMRTIPTISTNLRTFEGDINTNSVFFRTNGVSIEIDTGMQLSMPSIHRITANTSGNGMVIELTSYAGSGPVSYPLGSYTYHAGNLAYLGNSVMFYLDAEL